jgi:hypothetical protein
MGEEVYLFLAVTTGNTPQSLHGWVIFAKIRILKTPLLKIGIPVIDRCLCEVCLSKGVAHSVNSSSITPYDASSNRGGGFYIFCFRFVLKLSWVFLFVCLFVFYFHNAF